MDSIKLFAIDIDGTMTENDEGLIHLSAIQNLRTLEKLGYKIIYVTGRSSIEAYMLSVFGGTTKIAVGENGGVVTTSPIDHILLGSKEACNDGYHTLEKNLDSVKIKNVFNRMTEVVLERTFDISLGQHILDENDLNLLLTDSKYSYHINEKGINKATGLQKVLELMNIKPSETISIGDSETDIPVFRNCGLSIALGHSDNEVKKHSDHVVIGEEGVGLCDAIDYVSLNYLR